MEATHIMLAFFGLLQVWQLAILRDLQRRITHLERRAMSKGAEE